MIPVIDFSKLMALAPPGLIFYGFRGSISHGMYIPNTDPNSIDDIDLMGVFIAPKYQYIGLKNYLTEERKDNYEYIEGKYDIVNYEIRKFFDMLLKCNPNIISMLYLKNGYIKYTTQYWEKIIAKRELFLSKIVYNSFYNYANSQLIKMTHLSYKGYMGTKRKQLVDKFGFDLKNASHLIRLLKMGIELIRDGNVNVNRSDIDAQELLDIKYGKWSLDKVQKYSNELFHELDKYYEKTSLPDEPNKKEAEILLLEIIEEYYWRKI